MRSTACRLLYLCIVCSFMTHNTCLIIPSYGGRDYFGQQEDPWNIGNLWETRPSLDSRSSFYPGDRNTPFTTFPSGNNAGDRNTPFTTFPSGNYAGNVWERRPFWDSVYPFHQGNVRQQQSHCGYNRGATGNPDGDFPHCIVCAECERLAYKYRKPRNFCSSNYRTCARRIQSCFEGNYGTNQGHSFIPSSLEEELCGFCEALAVEKGHCKHHCNLYCSGGRK
uniref:Uncharacterized protein LOC111123549 isoform X2 n=1 Tax=Crassostrea virginica TaxID=6565 RepID=A0A8B8D1L0_CRAVI|nr:uncharacterized protein LOC111123549 isoform X2 [Crassostrea virginica]